MTMSESRVIDGSKVYGINYPLTQVQISAEAIEHSVKIRIGDQWVDITELGDLLIKAGQDFNAAIGRDNG